MRALWPGIALCSSYAAIMPAQNHPVTAHEPVAVPFPLCHAMRRIEKFLKLFIPPLITAPLRTRRKRREERRYDHIPDRQFYDGVFSPWLGYGAFGPLFNEIRPFTLVFPARA